MLTIHWSIPTETPDLAAMVECKRLASAVAKLIMTMEDHDGDGIPQQVARCREILYRSNCFEC